MSKLLRISAIAVTVLPALLSAQTEIQTAQNTLREWVQVEKHISSDQNQWLLEKEILTDMFRLLGEQKKAYQEAMEASSDTASAAETARSELIEERESFREVSNLLTETVADYEKRIRSFAPRLPVSLQQELGPLLRRIPSPDDSERVSMAARMQNVIGILSQMDRWNSTVTVVSEVQELDDGPREVRTLYLGLATAYFVDSDGTFAGYGLPVTGGWQWTEDSSLSADILRLMAIHDSAAEANFVGLPMQIR
jgi:hypothetical protein